MNSCGRKTCINSHTYRDDKGRVRVCSGNYTRRRTK